MGEELAAEPLHRPLRDRRYEDPLAGLGDPGDDVRSEHQNDAEQEGPRPGAGDELVDRPPHQVGAEEPDRRPERRQAEDDDDPVSVRPKIREEAAEGRTDVLRPLGPEPVPPAGAHQVRRADLTGSLIGHLPHPR